MNLSVKLGLIAIIIVVTVYALLRLALWTTRHIDGCDCRECRKR